MSPKTCTIGVLYPRTHDLKWLPGPSWPNLLSFQNSCKKPPREAHQPGWSASCIKAEMPHSKLTTTTTTIHSYATIKLPPPPPIYSLPVPILIARSLHRWRRNINMAMWFYVVFGRLRLKLTEPALHQFPNSLPLILQKDMEGKSGTHSSRCCRLQNPAKKTLSSTSEGL